MAKIIALAWKDTLLRFSSRSELLFFLILPIVFTALLSGAVSDQGPASISAVVVDEDGGDLAAALIAQIEAAESIQVERAGRPEAEARLEDRQAAAMLVIPAGFEAALLRGEPAGLTLRKLPNDLGAEAFDRATSSAVDRLTSALAAARNSVAAAAQLRPFASPDEQHRAFAAGLQMAREALAGLPSRLTESVALNESREGANATAAHNSVGQLITWVFIPLLGVSGLLAFERATGTLRRLVVTPTRRSTFLLGTIAGQLVLALLQMALLIAFAELVFKIDWGDSLPALALMLLAFGLASVALGTTLGTLVRSEGQASNLSIALGMVMALLGGCWFPLELFPRAAQSAAQALPTYWAMRGLSDLVLRRQGLADVTLEAAALGGFAVIFFVIGVSRFRYE
jgi:ABC-2 type transport system permease protein